MHLKSPDKAIREFGRVANESITLDFPNSSSLSLIHSIWRRIHHKYKKETQIYKIFSFAQIEHTCRKLGYKLEKKVAYFFIPISIHRFLNNIKVTLMIESFFSQNKICRLLFQLYCS